MSGGTKTWKLVLLLTGIFLAGAVTGIFGTVRFARHFLEKRPSPDQWAPARLKMLTDRLALTPEQVERLRPILRRDMEDLKTVRETSFKDTRAIFERMDRDIIAVLTPGQREKFEQMNREMRERFQKFMQRGPGTPGGKNDRPRRDGPPPGEGGEPPPPPAGPPPGGD